MQSAVETIEYESKAAPMPRVGEELPIFCEMCGYALHGMPQVRCEHCRILQFQCPECGHHQPINTLRPAAQRIISRIRNLSVVCLALFKIVYFGFLLTMWIVMGSAWSYSYTYNGRLSFRAAPDISNEMLIGFSVFAIAFGGVSRLLLLRWRSGWAVGGVLAILVMTAIFCGAWIEMHNTFPRAFISPAILTCGILAAALVTISASLSWLTWVMLVRVLMPRRACDALLAWQRTLSVRNPSNEMKAQIV